jgi:hypothetical protein
MSSQMIVVSENMHTIVSLKILYILSRIYLPMVPQSDASVNKVIDDRMTGRVYVKLQCDSKLLSGGKLNTVRTCYMLRKESMLKLFSIL